MIAALPAALWLLVLLANDLVALFVLIVVGAAGILLAGVAVGWAWGPKTDPSTGWRMIPLVVAVAFSSVVLVALAISVASVAQDLVDAAVASEELRDAPLAILGGWYVLLVTPFIPAFLGALPLAWLWYVVMTRGASDGVS